MNLPAKKSPINLLREFSIPLIAGIVAALAWANISNASYLHAMDAPLVQGLTLHFFTNDLFMVLFFGVAAVEITASLGKGGNLHPLSKAVNPLLATAGGVIGPIAFYFLLNAIIGSPAFTHGWGIPTATDIAIAWLVARFTFGNSHPCVSFLLLLAVADDAISLGIIAIFYPSPDHPVQPIWLLAVVGGVLIAWMLRRGRVRNYWPYLLGGIASWVGLFEANLHPSLALVFIVPFMPHQKLTQENTVFDAAPAGGSTLEHFERDWKWVVDFGLFLFGLCNAGVAFASVSAITTIVVLSLLLGKSLGISLFALLARRLGFALPAGVGMKELFVMALIGGIGLTVSLFVAGEAFTDPQMQGGAKMGALASALIAPAAILLSRTLGIARQST
jgi:Na+:H+ antiporter, NhaA family